MLSLLEERNQPRLCLKYVLLDFEISLWAALRSLLADGTLQGVTLRGCAFHYAQALYRRVQNLRLTDLFLRHPLVRNVITSTMHLGYLPVDLVKSEFDRLSDECLSEMEGCDFEQPLLDYLRYVHSNWIVGSRFSIQDFNCFRSKHRTNNIAESYHSQLRKRNFTDHMNSLALIYKLWQESQDVPSLMDDFLHSRGRLLNVRTSSLEHVLDTWWYRLENSIVTPKAFLYGLSCRRIVVEDPEFAEYYSRSHLE